LASIVVRRCRATSAVTADARSSGPLVGSRRGLRHRGRFVACGVLLAVGATAAATAVPAWAHTRPQFLITVQARIKSYAIPGFPINSSEAPREVTFSPDLVNVGTVIIKIANLDDQDHLLEVAGVSTPILLPGQRYIIHVRFKHPGVYAVSVTSDNPVPITGSIKVIK
jgi:hypothetical protein